jgi:hypothetical protein
MHEIIYPQRQSGCLSAIPGSAKLALLRGQEPPWVRLKAGEAHQYRLYWWALPSPDQGVDASFESERKTLLGFKSDET